MGTRIARHVRDVGGLGICIMGGSVLYFCTRLTASLSIIIDGYIKEINLINKIIWCIHFFFVSTFPFTVLGDEKVPHFEYDYHDSFDVISIHSSMLNK